MKRLFLLLLVLALAAAITGVAFAGGTTEKKAATGGAIKIGLSFSDFATERWPVEQALLTKLAYEKGAQVISQVANHDAKLQNDQIENMVLQGVNVLIIVAEDGDASATAAAAAHDAGVKVIAYDRLIKTSKIDAYISFDNVEVGRAQARGVSRQPPAPPRVHARRPAPGISRWRSRRPGGEEPPHTRPRAIGRPGS